jgi:hypothetical protein
MKETILPQTFIIYTILLLSAIDVSLSDASGADDFDSSSNSSATARRLLQKTAYTMPKLNFCEAFA